MIAHRGTCVLYFAFDDEVNGLFAVKAVERRVTCYHQVKNNTTTPYITLLIIFFIEEDFRSDVKVLYVI